MNPPNVKIQAAGAAGAISIVLVWIASLFGLDVPPEVASAVTALLAFGAGYLKTETKPTGRVPAAQQG